MHKTTDQATAVTYTQICP